MRVRFSGFECETAFGYYENGNNAIQLIDKHDGFKIATASVNGDRVVGIDTVGIKNWSENEGMADALIHAGVIEPEVIGIEPTGFVSILYYKLTERALEEVKNQMKGRKN